MEYLQKVSEVQYGRLHRVPKGTRLAGSEERRSCQELVGLVPLSLW